MNKKWIPLAMAIVLLQSPGYAVSRPSNGGYSGQPVHCVRISKETGIEDKVREIIATYLKTDKDSIRLDSDFAKDLGADSLDVVEIVMLVEKEYGFEFSGAELNSLKKVGDVVAVVQNRTKGEKAGGGPAIPGDFELAAEFSEGLARVESISADSRQPSSGFIDKSGKFVIETPPVFMHSGNFSGGLAWIMDYPPDSWDYRYGYIDKSGKWVFPAIFESASDFSEGLAAVAKDGKYGYIDRNGKWVIPASFTFASGFSEGLAVVVVDEKFGYIDKTGRIVIPAAFDNATRFSAGAAIVLDDGQFVYIDREGRKLPGQNSLNDLVFRLHDGLEQLLFSAEGLAPCWNDDLWRWGYMDKQGNVVIPPAFESAGPFSEGFAWVKINGKYGYIDTKGELVVPALFIGAGNVSEGMARVITEGSSGNHGWGYIRIGTK